MKRTMKALVLVLCVTMLVSVFTACGDVSGTYTYTLGNSLSIELEFATFGNKVTVTTTTGDDVDVEVYTYEITDEGKKIKLTNDEGDTHSESFEQGEDYIKLGLITYKKA